MGYGIVISAARDGHETYGFDIDADQVARFVQEGGASAPLEEIAVRLSIPINVICYLTWVARGRSG
ncbi:hypothetical protein [Roseobacter weihaiensis]|uniref:hypothetical protein n=1 Tax=Roseobacter weihaiensis TaxID=2763262 RepID=UPI00387304B9